MEVQKFQFEGLLLLSPKIYGDDRGFFCERFNVKDFAQVGLKEQFVQDNFSRSKYGVLRGMHYQYDPPQAKLVTCSAGQILDVAIDLRRNQPTYGQFQTVILSGDKPQWFYVPAGFAHGFLVLSKEGADVIYKVNALYNPKTEGSILWNDSHLNIPWGNTNPLMSPKDQIGTSWKDFEKINPF